MTAVRSSCTLMWSSSLQRPCHSSCHRSGGTQLSATGGAQRGAASAAGTETARRSSSPSRTASPTSRA
eukprot:15447890-Alexandrium_andersonii.AAC.1